MVRQKRFAHIHHSAINLDHGDVLNTTVLGHFTQHAAIAAANDQYTLDGAVRQNRHMGQHLVIDELIGFGGLNNPVQRHDTAHHRVFENNQMLVFGSHFMEQLVHAKTLAVAFVKGFKIIGFKRFGHGKSP